jgi:hypothetical protein
VRGKLGRPATLAMALLALGGLLAGASATAGAQETPAELAKITDYQAARWHRLHFKPAIDTATNEQCLACHQEILTGKVREASPAGLKSANAEAWYQTLDTYAGPQETFHARHMTTPFAKQVMNLNCTFCHQGADPREKAPGSHADGQEPAASTQAPAAFTLRKTVNPSTTCLRCHGQFPNQNMGIDPWTAVREGMETPETPNGCMTCHAELFRTVRHQVSYLKPDAIEALAKTSADVCYGCHGGRGWYRISYPYPRHPWPNMDASQVPDWAKDRPTESDAKYRLPRK